MQNLRNDTHGDVDARTMITAVIAVFLLALLGAAFTPTLQTQVDSWEENLTTAGQTGAASVVNLIPLIFWLLLAIGIVLMTVATFLPGRVGGL